MFQEISFALYSLALGNVGMFTIFRLLSSKFEALDPQTFPYVKFFFLQIEFILGAMCSFCLGITVLTLTVR